mgnify:CR=1 FL=1
MVESHRDCLGKYELAALLASRLGEVALYERYRILAQTEAARLQRHANERLVDDGGGAAALGDQNPVG